MASQINNNNPYICNNFKKFSSGVDLSSNKAYLANIYQQNQQTDSFEDREKKKKKNKLKFTLAAASSFLVLLTGLTTAIKTQKIDVESIKKGVQNINPKSKMAAVRNCSVNFANIKDDLWRRFGDWLAEKSPVKIKFVKKFNDKFTDIYRNIANDSLSKKITSSTNKMKELAGTDEAILSTIGLKEFNFDEINSEMAAALREKNISGNLYKRGGGLKQLKEKLVSPLGNTAIADVVKKHSNIIDIDKLKAQGAADELIKEAEKYNSIQLNELFPKLRDINCGSAPTDIITAAVPLAAFGAALACEDDKEKKKSILVNIGLPLLPTFLMPFVGLKFPILNGFKGMMAGFAVGQVFKQGVKFVDRKIIQNSNSKPNRQANENETVEQHKK